MRLMAEKNDNVMNRTAKASVFEDLFSDENYLLALYKVLHPEDTEATVSDLKNVNLKNILTRGIYNDLGFMVGNQLMILVEAQSTWTVNIIPRCIMYLAETWKRYFREQGYDLYSTSKVDIPEPELYVIYTGDKKLDKEYISLSEEFFNGKKTAVDVTVKILVNSGEKDIVDQYIIFCNILDEQRKLYPDDDRKAVNETIRICLENGILMEYLLSRKKEVVDIMLTLYSQEEATEMMLTNERKNAEKRGEKNGEIRGAIAMCQEFGKSIADTVSMIAKKFGLSESASHKLVNQYWKA